MKIRTHTIRKNSIKNLPRVSGTLEIYESKAGVPMAFQWNNQTNKPPRITISPNGIYLNNTSYNLLGRQRQLAIGYNKTQKILLISRHIGNDREVYTATTRGNGAVLIDKNKLIEAFGMEPESKKYEPLWSINHAALVVMMEDYLLPDKDFE